MSCKLFPKETICIKYQSLFSGKIQNKNLALVAQSNTRPTFDKEFEGFYSGRIRQHSSVEIDHEIFSTVILSVPLIQEGQLSVSGERMCTSTAL